MAEQRLIDANALLKKLSKMIDYCEKDSKVNVMTALFQVGDAIMDCPTVEAKPVVHAHWKKENNLFYVCSKCKTTLPYNFEQEYITHWQCNYCPNCGAQMDEKEINDG